MQTREKSDLSYLTQYSQRMWDFSGHMLSRPLDAPTDATGCLGVGTGTSRAWAQSGLSPVDVESSLRSLDVPLGKYGQQAQVIHNTRMTPVGNSDTTGCPTTIVSRLEYPARDVRSAAGRMAPGPPVRDDMPIHPVSHLAGAPSRIQLRDTFGYRA
jgi:hypothetical protein